MPLFTIKGPNARAAAQFDTPFALHQDNWNDYGFKTQYHLYKKVPSGEPEMIGTVKILRRGQTPADPILIAEDFDALPEDFVSVGESFDYYQRLNELVPIEGRDQVLIALRDAIFNPSLVDDFRDENGWNTSLFRGSSQAGQPREKQDIFLRDARAICSGNFTELPELSEPIRFAPEGWRDAFEVTFDAPDTNPLLAGFVRRRGPDSLPRRGAVIIGPNGSGKSTLLSRLARVAFASPSERTKDTIRTLGVLEPDGLGFFKIISISYSAFDSFSLPGVYADEFEQIAKDVERGDGRFIYCGLRDIVAEVRDILQANAAAQPDTGSLGRLPIALPERLETVALKSLDQLADEFVRYVNRIEQKNRDTLFAQAMKLLLADQSFATLEERSVDALLGESPRAAFLAWSTGHKIALHVVAALVAHAENRALVLFDEPETHLHPPMIAAMMHAVRHVLEETQAVAVIATHSPVVLQETLARHVRVIRRSADGTTVVQPTAETFGENIGTLVHDTFGLRADDTNFHRLLDHLVETNDTVDQMDSYFEPGLSAQARAYVIARLAEKEEG